MNDPSKFTPAQISENFWQDQKKRNRIQYSNEEKIFHLSHEEAQKCRYEIIDMTMRMAECATHRDRISHGVRLHPPHLWDIRDGVVYQKVNGEWVMWTADVKKNIDRFDKE